MSIGNFLTTEEAAAKIERTAQLVRRYIEQGRLKAIKSPKGEWWIDSDDLQEFIKIPRKRGRPVQSGPKKRRPKNLG